MISFSLTVIEVSFSIICFSSIFRWESYTFIKNSGFLGREIFIGRIWQKRWPLRYRVVVIYSRGSNTLLGIARGGEEKFFDGAFGTTDTKYEVGTQPA